jgi:hypothetical protein|eukprot:COSAG06_NODE_213_length_20138_cov_13.586295_12_plen_153_part_00
MPDVHPAGGTGTRVRFFTRRECARLMGFPEWFRVDLGFGLAGGGARGDRGSAPDDGAVDGNRFYAQIGNAVCPPVVTSLAEPLLEAMGVPLDRGDGSGTTTCMGASAAAATGAAQANSMSVDGEGGKRKREVEKQPCAERPGCACAGIFVRA